ncbi:replication initiator [Citromicrobium phage vB_Cib_ssDNA_P1]|nr:replication initiator [Citromicrobium phage vB_Cib_ssDNA_P1]
MARDDARDYLWRQQLGDGHNCSRPVELPSIGLPSMLEPDRTPLPVTIMARCRKCPECLAHRRRLWTARAVDEVQASSRTWFGTLTVAPAHRVRLAYRAEAKVLRAGGESLSSLDRSERYRILANELGQEVTKWLKRVRKQSGASLRYLLVAEAHKSGDPHMHILVHEDGDPVTKRMLQDQWRIGFSQWKLVDQDPGAAVYVCKYLAKDALTRVRASRRYGQPQLVRSLTERIHKMRDAVHEASSRREPD